MCLERITIQTAPYPESIVGYKFYSTTHRDKTVVHDIYQGGIRPLDTLIHDEPFETWYNHDYINIPTYTEIDGQQLYHYPRGFHLLLNLEDIKVMQDHYQQNYFGGDPYHTRIFKVTGYDIITFGDEDRCGRFMPAVVCNKIFIHSEPIV